MWSFLSLSLLMLKTAALGIRVYLILLFVIERVTQVLVLDVETDWTFIK